MFLTSLTTPFFFWSTRKQPRFILYSYSSWENFIVTSYHFSNEKVKTWRRDSNIKADRSVLLNLLKPMDILHTIFFSCLCFKRKWRPFPRDKQILTPRDDQCKTTFPLSSFFFEQTLSPLPKEKKKKYKIQEKPQLQKQNHTLKSHWWVNREEQEEPVMSHSTTIFFSHL